MNDIERLLAIEEIKRLKARYFYAFDHKDWTMWREQVFAPDGRLEVPEMDFVVEGIDTMIPWLIKQAADQGFGPSRPHPRYRDSLRHHRQGPLGDGGPALPVEGASAAR